MSTILAVDDSPEMHRLYRTVVHGMGHRLLKATSGSEALLVMEMSFPDLLLLDLAMPEMDGLEFLRVVRQAPEWRTIPVVVITAFGNEADFGATRVLGAAGHLVKGSFSVKELRGLIGQSLKGDPRPGPPPGPAGSSSSPSRWRTAAAHGG